MGKDYNGDIGELEGRSDPPEEVGERRVWPGENFDQETESTACDQWDLRGGR